MEAHQRHTQPRGVRVQHALRGEVQDLLDQLATAFTRGDGEAVAALWELPAIMISADRVSTLTSRADVAELVASVKADLGARGIASTRADLLDLERVGDRIVIATVRWPYVDASGHEIGTETADYTLRRDDAGRLRIRSELVRGAS